MAWQGYRTLSKVLSEADNRPSGFDYMRLILSVGVLVSHSVLYNYGDPAGFAFWDSPARPFLKWLVPMFFALSGFLVAGSLDRSKSAISYMGLRAIRIFPALAGLVIVTAFVIGPMTTSLPLQAYFKDSEFTRYLMGVFGHLGFTLPGVFTDLPYPNNVNSQLWTIPYEIKAYFILGVLMVLGVSKRGYLALLAAVALLGRDLFRKFSEGSTFEAPMSTGGEFLMPLFLCGAGLYFYRAWVPHNLPLFVLSAALSVVFLGYVKGGEYIAVLPTAYVTVYLGTLNPKRTGVSAMGDYSYAIYLWGGVIQQAVVFAFPEHREWYWNLLIATPICLMISWLSWMLVERPAMTLRRPLAAIEGFLLGVCAQVHKRAVAWFQVKTGTVPD
ncbi:acyltransferase family protein [Asticcacaulis endophyticus]|uniref:Acyltransferase n=1 Tax=Asticcacaulis endophyticus TaxID=1395890 RepID=A0A918Q322_9CAUL|nr:acyltransferase [Asticcacaulis endophyticus]GGZ30624.1 acyltransferase [Asticcacaulis endophyticus]